MSFFKVLAYIPGVSLETPTTVVARLKMLRGNIRASPNEADTVLKLAMSYKVILVLLLINCTQVNLYFSKYCLPELLC